MLSKIAKVSQVMMPNEERLDSYLDTLDEAEHETFGFVTVPPTCAVCEYLGVIGKKMGHCELRGFPVYKHHTCIDFTERIPY